jgi:hypothetical protein
MKTDSRSKKGDRLTAYGRGRIAHTRCRRAGAGVTGQGFSSKINDELTLFACNSGLQALQKCQPKNVSRLPFGTGISLRVTRVASQHIEIYVLHGLPLPRRSATGAP